MRGFSNLRGWKGCVALLSILLLTGAIVPEFDMLVSFDGINGANPFYVTPVQGMDGYLYGTTQYGGANGDGAIFKISPTGALTTIYSFCSET